MAFAIWIMVVIGGTTRLTGSGLSITEWKPIMGTIPPLTQEHWEEAFELYKATPQYKLANSDMELAGFKTIFFWEYLHRLWGRLLGVFFAVPFLYFAIRGQFNRPWMMKLLGAFFLGGAQGFLGWFMVQSGLVDKPWVSPYRLTAHLLAALALFSYLLWLACDILIGKSSAPKPLWTSRGAMAILVVMGLQITWGGLMAGGKFALSYPTFPDMNGSMFPPALLNYQSFFQYFCENPATVQFLHRGLATLLVIGILCFWIATRKMGWSGAAGWALRAVLGLVFFQFLLGAATVMQSLGSVPVFLGVSHQATATLLLGATLILVHQTRRKQTSETSRS